MADQAGWPPWARNAFIAQLVINFALLVLLATMHFLGQHGDHVARRELTVRIDAAIESAARVQGSVDSLESQLGGMEVRIQTQDTWIQTTRSRLIQQGFETPEYRPATP